MSYCRFQNTLRELLDIYEHLEAAEGYPDK